MKPSKILAISLVVISFGTITSLSQPASASSTSPKSMRGYYIGNHHLVWLTKRTLGMGAPVSDLYHNHVTSVSKHGKTYKFHTYINYGAHYTRTYTIKKIGYHKLHINGFGTIHKVTKSHYYRYANGGY